MRPLLVAAFAVLGPGLAGCSEDPKPLEVGKVREVNLETPHPYPQGQEGLPVWQERIEHPGAGFLKVHFVDVDLASGEEGEDYVVLRDGEGVERYRFSASDLKPTGEIWALAVDGDQVVVELHATVGGGEGFRIDRYGHGYGDGDGDGPG